MRPLLVRRKPNGKLAFSGVLNEPIFVPRDDTPAAAPMQIVRRDETSAEKSSYIIRARIDKLMVLCRELQGEADVAPEKMDWVFVAFYLASAFVPGFAVTNEMKRRRGRPRKPPFGGPGPANDFALTTEIERMTASGVCGISRACEHLSRRPGPWKGRAPKTLETRYHRHRKLMAAQKQRQQEPRNFGRNALAALLAPAAKIED